VNSGIRNSGGTTHELGPRSVVSAHTEEPPQHTSHVAAECTAKERGVEVGVQRRRAGERRGENMR
jgi:hypothetical protein